jgi:predicted nucleic acid-binding protein
MIFIDSWIWIELFSEGEKHKKAREILKTVSDGEAGVISAICIAEIRYRLSKKLGSSHANEVTYLMENYPNLKIMPVTTDVAKLAADLRVKYYKKPDKMVSYADMINLATALLAKCDVLYSGDPDFKGIDEIKIGII